MTSGTVSGRRRLREEDQEGVYRVLNREVRVPALEALVAALEPPKEEWEVTGAAIALDTNVVLRLAGHRGSEDIADYLISKHQGPIILPGQTITEFWNNQMAAVETVAGGLVGDLGRLRQRLTGLEEEFGDVLSDLDGVVERFQGEHGHVYSAATVHRTRRLLGAFQERAIVPFVTRTRFQPLAEHRYQTKTPPGFADSRIGDFFVWADFLLGLSVAWSRGMRYRTAVFVTNDKKVDWIRNGVAHPVLVAEARAVGGGPFAIWSVETLAEKISSVTSAPQ